MLASYLHKLGHWLTYQALYQMSMEGSSEIQDTICTFFDDFISGAPDEQTPQQHMRVQHGRFLRKISDLLKQNRLSKLRAYFSEHPVNTF
jgi:hypothetical protein